MTIKDNTARVSCVFGDLKPGQAFREVANPDILWMKKIISYSSTSRHNAGIAFEAFNAVNLNDGSLREFVGNENVIVVNAEIVVN